MESKLSLSILVPVYNEQYLVETSLKRLEVLAASRWLERVRVVVVNDASTDQTGEVLKDLRESWGSRVCDGSGMDFLEHEKNQGKGAAIRTALQQADTDLVVIHDADLEYHPEDLLKMVPLFANGRCGCSIRIAVPGQRLPSRAVFPAQPGQQTADVC